MKSPIEQARAYIAKLPLAVSGQRGHDVTFRVACCLVHGFLLAHDDAMKVMHEYNGRLLEPWTDADLLHKIEDAGKAGHRLPKGHLLRMERPYKALKGVPQTPAVRWPIVRRDPPSVFSARVVG